MLRTLFSPDRWQTSYSALPTSWRSAASSPGNTPLAQEDYSAPVRHVKAAMNRSRKVLLSLALVGVLIVSAPFILRLDAQTFAYSSERVGSWASLSAASSEAKEALDGTPRTGLFAPLAGSAEPSVLLRAYLDSHFGPPSSSQYHVWVTMADAGWARSGTAAMHAFVEQLNAERRVHYGRRPGGTKETRLVVLCLDEECIDVVGRYKNAYGKDAGGGYAYGGYLHNRPEKVRIFDVLLIEFCKLTSCYDAGVCCRSCKQPLAILRFVAALPQRPVSDDCELICRPSTWPKLASAWRSSPSARRAFAILIQPLRRSFHRSLAASRPLLCRRGRQLPLVSA